MFILKVDFVRHRRLGFLMVVIAFLAFTSQAFSAVLLPCAEMESHSGQAESVMNMAHGDHDHMSHMPDKAASPDCCGEGKAQCNPSHCASTSVAVTVSSLHLQLAGHPTLNSFYTASMVIAESSSLFRPPIFC